MLTDFCEGGVADFVAEADFRAAETEILRRRLAAAQELEAELSDRRRGIR